MPLPSIRCCRLRMWCIKSTIQNVHSVQLGRSTLGDLLNTELAEFGLQLIELLGEIILALSPELTGLDLGARL